MSGKFVTIPDPTLLPGFFGKVPARGDFVSSRLSSGFVTRWDDWLQDGMVASRRQMGEDWVETYMSCPLWFFTLTAGLCGEHAVAGLLMASIDAVGRHFPFTMAARLPSGSDLTQLPGAAEEWFTAAMNVAADIRGSAFDFESFDQRVKALGPLPAITAGTDCAAVAASVWWTAGKSDPTRLTWPGMPPEADFARLLRADLGRTELVQDAAARTPASNAWTPQAWEPESWPETWPKASEPGTGGAS